MARTACAFDKLCLKKSRVEMVGVWGRTEEKKHYFTWLIGNFKRLKKNKEYKSQYKQTDWFFYITKKNRFYSVRIYTGEYDGEIACSVCYSDDSYSSPIVADKISWGNQSVNFPDSMVEVPENTLLQRDNNLKFAFKFNKECTILNPTLSLRDIDDLSTYECLHKIVNSTRNKQLTDFFIFVENRVLCVHKAILAARSTYFRQYIKENCTDGQNGEITVDVTFEAMYVFMSFLYTGHMVFKSADELIQILALSKKFGISSLQTYIRRCMKNVFIQKLITEYMIK